MLTSLCNVKDELVNQDLLLFKTNKIRRGLISLENVFDNDDWTKLGTHLLQLILVMMTLMLV